MVRFVRISVWLMLAVVPWPVSAQESGDDGRRRIDIERIEVRGQRLLKDIGVQRTRLDTVALHDNIAQSLGDVMLQNTNTFIKSYVRGSMASISVRGTAPSHTEAGVVERYATQFADARNGGFFDDSCLFDRRCEPLYGRK